MLNSFFRLKRFKIKTHEFTPLSGQKLPPNPDTVAKQIILLILHCILTDHQPQDQNANKNPEVASKSPVDYVGLDLRGGQVAKYRLIFSLG